MIPACQPNLPRPVTLSMEVLNCYQKARSNRAHRGWYTVPTDRKKPWVAEIIGLHPEYGLDRNFLEPLEDKTDALSTRSRDGHRIYHLMPGNVYDVFEHTSFKHEERYLCKIESGKIVKITKEEALDIVLRRG